MWRIYGKIIRSNVRDVTIKAYQVYFGIKLGDQDRPWSPTQSYYQKPSAYGLKVNQVSEVWVPMVWREPKDHHDDCYFCMVNMSGWNRHEKNSWHYSDIESERRPVPHCSEFPVPGFTSLPDIAQDSAFIEAMDECSDSTCSSNNFNDPSSGEFQTSKVNPFTQGQLNDLVRDSALSKEAAEILASRLCEHRVLDSEAKITFYLRREELIRYFSEEADFVFCNSNIQGLLLAMRLSQCNPDGWLLFINSSKRSLECIAT